MCAVYRVRHSEFLDWLASDRDKAIWQFLRERQTCPQCGTRDEEWLDDTGKRKQAYIAHLIECEGCVVKARGERDYDVELREFRGTRVGLTRNEEVA